MSEKIVVCARKFIAVIGNIEQVSRSNTFNRHPNQLIISVTYSLYYQPIKKVESEG